MPSSWENAWMVLSSFGKCIVFFKIARHPKKVLFMDPKSSTNRCQVMFQTPFFYPDGPSAWHPFRWIASRRGWFSLSGQSPFAPRTCFGEIYQGVPLSPATKWSKTSQNKTWAGKNSPQKKQNSLLTIFWAQIGIHHCCFQQIPIKKWGAKLEHMNITHLKNRRIQLCPSPPGPYVGGIPWALDMC